MVRVAGREAGTCGGIRHGAGMAGVWQAYVWQAYVWQGYVWQGYVWQGYVWQACVWQACVWQAYPVHGLGGTAGLRPDAQEVVKANEGSWPACRGPSRAGAHNEGSSSILHPRTAKVTAKQQRIRV